MRIYPSSTSLGILGGHVSVLQGQNHSLMDRRLLLAAGMARKLARLPISVALKAHAVLGKILPFAMYGAEIANPSES